NIAVDFEFEVNATYGHNRFRRQRAGAQLSCFVGFAYCLLDLSLGGDTELLEELTHAGVQSFFVHNCSPSRLTAPLIEEVPLNAQAVDTTHTTYIPASFHRQIFGASRTRYEDRASNVRAKQGK